MNLKDLLETLNNKIKSYRKRNSGGAKACRIPPVTRAIIEIPDVILDEYRGNEKKKKRDNRRNRHIARAAVWAASIYAAIAAAQLAMMINANTISRDALVSVQRAFVVPVGLSPTGFLVPTDKTKVGAWEFKMVWENSGATPARTVLLHISSHPFHKRGIPEDFTYPQLGKVTKIPTVIGPKGTKESFRVKIDPKTIQNVKDKTARLFFWGTADYKDVFEKSHITKFCVELNEVNGDPFVSDPLIRFAWDDCPKHNCSDEDCQNR